MPRTLFCLPVEDTKEGLLLRLPEGGYGCDPEAWAVIEALSDYSQMKKGQLTAAPGISGSMLFGGALAAHAAQVST